jgi:Zn-dependent protease with chaperone function
MRGAPPSDRPSFRLNPFAFPSDTTSRFALLLLFAIAASVLIWSSMAMLGLSLQAGFANCSPNINATVNTLREQLAIAMEHLQQGTAIPQPPAVDTAQCYRPLNRRILPAMAIGAGLLASFTLGIWWLHPHWLAWRMKLSRLQKDEAPELVAALTRICSVAGLRRTPDFYWNPLGMAPRALAYGRAGRYRLALTGAMAMRYATDPSAFRAVILHELAHIVNRDIDKTWLAVGAWWALVASALVPRVALQFWIPFRWVDVAASAIQVAAITSLVFVTRNAMLRARELYADARASVWMSDSYAMAAALSALRPVRGLRRLLSPHPDPAHRLRLLAATDPLFRAGFWDLVGVGAATSLGAAIIGIVGANVGNVALLSPGWAFLLQFGLPVLVVTPLASVAAGIIIWRASFASLVRGTQPRAAVRGGIAAGLGTVLGTMVAQAGGLPLLGAGSPSVPPVLVASMATWAIIQFLSPIMGLIWVEAAAKTWIPIALRRPHPGASLKAAVGLNCVFTVPWFALAGPFLLALAVLWLLEPAFVGPLLYQTSNIFPLNVVGALSVAVTWGFPMAAWLWQRPLTPGIAEWAFLTPPRPPLSHLTLPLAPGRSIAIALVAGIVAGVMLGSVQVPWVPTLKFGVEQTPDTTRFVAMMITAVLTQAAVATLVVFVVSAMRVIQAMFAAFVAGNVLAIAFCLQMWEFDPSLIVLCLQVSYGFIIIGGAVAALPSALIAAMVKTGFTRIGSRLGSRESTCTGSGPPQHVPGTPIVADG